MKTMIQQSFILIILLFIGQFAWSQNTITGLVKDEAGLIPDAPVILNGTALKQLSNLDGKFEFKNVPNGTYYLIIQSSEYPIYRDTITLNNNGVVNLGAILLDADKSKNEIEEVVVNGKLAEGDNKANKMQKNENVIGNVEYVGDGEQVAYNAGDNLQKMPAVTVQKDQGEGRYMSVRGTPTDWNSSMLNGDRLPVADENSETRTMAFDVISSDLLDYIKVAKALTPDMEGDAIGGSVNFITKSSPDSTEFKINLMGGYSAQSQKPIYNGNFFYGTRSKNGKFGFLINGSAYVRNWGTDNYEVVYGSNYNQGVNRLELRDYTGMRSTYSGNIALDYKFTPNNKIYFKSMVGRFTDDEYDMKTRYNYAIGAGSTIMLQHIHSVQQSLLYGGELGTELKLSKKLFFDGKVAFYSNQYGYGKVPFKSKDKRNGYLVENFEKFNVHFKDQIYIDKNGQAYRQDQNGNPIDGSGNVINDPSLELARVKLLGKDNPFGDGDSWNNIQPQIQGSNSAGDYEFSGAYSELNTTWERDPLIVNANFKYEASKNLTLKIGGKTRYKEGYRSLSLHNWYQDFNTYSGSLKITNYPTAPLNLNGGFLQELGQPYAGTFMPFLKPNEIDGLINNLGDTLREEPMTVAHHDYYEFVGSTYSYTEAAEAVYAMAEWKIKPRLTIIGGIRVEMTQLRMTADSVLDGENDWYLANIYNIDGDYKVVPIDNDPYAGSGITPTVQYTVAYPVVKSRLKRNYYAPLPMVHLRFDQNDNTVWRAAITRTYRRPNFIETKPGTAVIDYTNLEFNQGNPNLKPAFSWNVDLSYEHYMKNAGLFSVGLYGKVVTDHIYRTITADIDPQLGIIYKSYQNAEKPVYVAGIEINGKKKFDFLPSFLRNFGVDANFTLTYSQMQIPGRSFKQALPMQPPVLVNCALLYEGDKGLKIRAALNYTAGYLMEVNTSAVSDDGKTVRLLHDNTDYDVFMRYKWSLDVSASYKITKYMQVYTEISNILNQPLYIYRGESFRPMQVEYYALRATLGVKFNF